MARGRWEEKANEGGIFESISWEIMGDGSPLANMADLHASRDDGGTVKMSL